MRMFFSAITDLGSLVAMGIAGIFFLLTDLSIFIKLFVAVALNWLIISTIRLNYYKHRPYKRAKPRNILGIITESSFPSAHSSQAVLFAIVVGLSTNTTLFVFFLGVAVLIMLSRWYLKKHYPVDIFFGALLGALVGVFTIMVL